MNRLLTILLLAAATTAHGQINNPPTPSSIGLGWSALTNPQSSLYSGTATKLLGYVAETNPSGSGLTGFNVMAYTNTNTLVIPANLLIAEDAVPAARNPRNVTVQGAVTIQYPYSSPNTIYGNNSLTATDDSTYTNTLATWNSNTVTFATNVTASGTLAVTGDTVLSGVNNTMPNATNAASEASLMTRGLVGQEFANPRTKIQTTYWFGLEGLGGWQTVNSGATAIANRTPKFGPSLAFYAPAKPATSASGVGVRLGAAGITGAGAWRPADGGAFTARSHVVNYYSATGAGNLAFGFSFAAGNNTNFWAAPDCFGLFWVQQPTNSWAASTAFAQHDRIAVSNVVWAVATAGTTAATAPTWTDLIGSTVTNGTAVFRNIGPHTSNNWVLAIGHTNASQVVMTNTGKSSWLRSTGGSGHDVLLALRYGTNTTGPYTVYGSVADGTGQGSEVALNLAANTTQVSPQYWLRYDGTNTTTGNEAAGIRYFSIDAELPPLN